MALSRALNARRELIWRSVQAGIAGVRLANYGVEGQFKAQREIFTLVMCTYPEKEALGLSRTRVYTVALFSSCLDGLWSCT